MKPREKQEKFLNDSSGFSTQVLTCTIDKDALEDFRYRFPAWMDADTFNVIR